MNIFFIKVALVITHPIRGDRKYIFLSFLALDFFQSPTKYSTLSVGVWLTHLVYLLLIYWLLKLATSRTKTLSDTSYDTSLLRQFNRRLLLRWDVHLSCGIEAKLMATVFMNYKYPVIRPLLICESFLCADQFNTWLSTYIWSVFP